MPFGNPAGDRQSQTRPFRLLRSGAKEAIEESRLGAPRKERSDVQDFDDEAAVASPDGHIDSPAGRCVSHRIVDEARKQGAHFVRGAPANGLTGEIHFEINLLVVGDRRVIRDGLEDERIDVDGLVLDGAALFEPRQMEQLIDERARAPNAARKSRGRSFMGASRLPRKVFDLDLHPGERRPEFVSGVGNEFVSAPRRRHAAGR